MSTPLAPTRSTRPAPRPGDQQDTAPRSADPVESALADAFFAALRAQQDRDRVNQGAGEPDRAQQHDMMRQFGNLELRADMDPYLANDPLARLGFDPDQIDYFSPYGKISAFYAPNGLDMLDMVGSRETALRFNDMYPENDYRVPEDTILMTPFYPPAILAHESRHRGIELLRRDPNATLPENTFNEEGVVEIGDLPYLDEAQPTPRGTIAFEQGWSPVSVRRTLDEGTQEPITFFGVPRHATSVGQERQRTFDQLQAEARDALRRQGEVPRATMQGNPRQALREMRRITGTGGIGGLFRRVIGGD